MWGSAAEAALLYLPFRPSGSGVLLAVVPIIGMLLATLPYCHRQQDAIETAREAAAAAAARAAEVAARHLRELQDSERPSTVPSPTPPVGMALLLFEGTIPTSWN